jgi:histidyl-tRNA synthetase
MRSIEAFAKFFKEHNPFAFGGVSERIGDLSSLVNVFAEVGVGECVIIDFGIVRGLGYYTGFGFGFFDSDLAFSGACRRWKICLPRREAGLLQHARRWAGHM